jgi:hypothetical protein
VALTTTPSSRWLKGRRSEELRQEALQRRLQSRLSDGEQVGPASAKPVNGYVPRARESSRESARAYPSWPGINGCQRKRPDILKQSNLSRQTSVRLRTRRSPYTAVHAVWLNRQPSTQNRHSAPVSEWRALFFYYVKLWFDLPFGTFPPCLDEDDSDAAKKKDLRLSFQ